MFTYATDDNGSSIKGEKTTSTYTWVWKTKIDEVSGDITVKLIQRHPSTAPMEYEFLFESRTIKNLLQTEWKLGRFELPRKLSAASRFIDSATRQALIEACADEQSFRPKDKGHSGFLQEQGSRVVLNKRYISTITYIARFKAIWAAMSCFGRYDFYYGGRNFDYGQIVCPVYFGASPVD